jgi:hypothetical protein
VTGAEAARRCRSCNSIVCPTCLPQGAAGSCIHCVIEDGQRWFAPAEEEPVERPARRIPVALMALVLLGPLLIVVVAELMGRLQPNHSARAPVRFQLR